MDLGENEITVRNKRPQRGPSYVAILLNMTDAVDGFSFTPRARSTFSLVQSNTFTLSIRRSSLACWLLITLFVEHEHCRVFC